MQPIAKKVWQPVMVMSLMLVFAGLALADQDFTILTFDEPMAETKRSAPVAPGTLATTVDLSPEQLKALSGSGEFAIYGSEMQVSRDQIVDMPESKSFESKAQTETLDVGRAWINIRGRLVNNREFWSENSRTLAVTQSEVSAAVYGNHIVVGWNDFATAYVAYEAGFQSGNPSIKLRRSTDKFASEIDVSRGPVIPGAIFDASLFCGRDAIKGNIRR